MPFVTAGNLDVYHEVAGDGPRLLFISGTGGDLRVRPNVFDGPLSRHFEVLAYDQRGLGRTGKPPGPYRMSQYGDDAAALLDALGWETVPVMGVSFGGMVAQELALRHPDRVSRLVLACTSAGGQGGASYPLHELGGLSEAMRIERQLELGDTRRNAAWRAAHPDNWDRLVSEVRKASVAVDPVEAVALAEGGRAQLAARARHDTWERLPGLRLPVLVAGGRFDGIAPPANQQALATRIPGAELAMFDGGHLFLIQDRDAYPYVIRWLNQHH